MLLQERRKRSIVLYAGKFAGIAGLKPGEMPVSGGGKDLTWIKNIIMY
jgi:hypothetical protein